MNAKQRYITAALALLLLLGLGYLLSQHLVEKTRTVRSLAGAEARANPLLAATRYLQRMGQTVESTRNRRRLDELPPSGDTVLLYRVRIPSATGQLEALLEWVEQGGTLVMDVAHLWDDDLATARSAMLDELDVRLVDTENDDTATISIDLTDDPAPLSVGFDARLKMIDESENAGTAIWDDEGAYLLEYDYGDGRITLVNDLGLISNSRIGEDENAYFLTLLAATPNSLWMLYDPSRPSLMALAWQHASAVLISLLVLALCVFWAANRRIGPTLVHAENARRDRKEHIEAQGRFDYRKGLLPERVQALRQTIEHGWLMRHPALRALGQRERADWIAARSGQRGDEVFDALYADNTPDYVNQIALLQRLRHRNL